MDFNKKQIKYLLEVISKDKYREALTKVVACRTEDGQDYWVATDGYQAVLIHDEFDDATIGKGFTREFLTRWYKLAERNDHFIPYEHDLELVEVPNFPDVFKVIDNKTNAQEGCPTFCINYRYLQNMEELANGPALEWSNVGKLTPYVAKYNNNIYVIMPIKH